MVMRARLNFAFASWRLAVAPGRTAAVWTSFTPTRLSSSSSSSASRLSSTAPATETDARSVTDAVDSPTSTPRRKTHAERDAEALQRFEARFGGQEQVQLGELTDGKPEGLSRAVRDNMFRVIGNG